MRNSIKKKSAMFWEALFNIFSAFYRDIFVFAPNSVCLPGGQRFPKMGFSLKGKNLLR